MIPVRRWCTANPDGKFTVALSAIDLGQGMKQVSRQIAAETLGVPIEDVYVDTADSDTGPHDMGCFASRGTHRVGNAVIVAAKEARGVLLEAAAEELEVNADDLDTDGKGNIHVKGAPRRNRSPSRTQRIAAQFKQGKTISGRGIFLIPLSDGRSGDRRDVARPPAMRMPASSPIWRSTTKPAKSHGQRMTSAYELGRALNPQMVEQQLVGGAWMGMSHALYETPEPYYPDPAHGGRDYNEYLMPGPGDIARTTSRCWSARRRTARSAPRAPARCAPIRCCRRSPTRSSTRSACASTTLPITPEKILRALKAQGGARPQARRHRESAMAVRGKCWRHRRPGELAEALRAAFYLADDGFATAAYLALALGKPLLLEGAPGVGKTEAAKAIAGVLGAAADPAAMLRGHRRRRRAVRMELPAPDAGDPPGRRRADRHLSRRFPDRAADAGGAARAGIAVLLIDEIDRSDHEFEAFLLEFLSDFSDLDPGARHVARARAPGGDPHLEPHARAARGAAAPLRLSLHRLSGRRSARRGSS